MDVAALRAELPVLEELAWLNAGTCGPLPRAAGAAVRAALEQAEREGRAGGHFAGLAEAQAGLRARYARLLGAAPEEVALTTSTTDGIARVLAGLDWRAGDELVLAEGEHPGLTGPVAALARRAGVVVRTAPLERITEAVGARTRLVACSHVRWSDGELAPLEALRALPGELPVLLDGAQGAGAIPVDAPALPCAFYAAPGQKWLCGPIGTGMLWIAPAWRGRLAPAAPGYVNLAVPGEGLDAEPWADARGFDAFALARETAVAATAAFDVLDRHGWDAVPARAIETAAALAEELRERGRTVAGRGPTTLVSWEDADPPATVARLATAGVVVRDLPGTSLVRASVGAWTDERDLDRLLAALA
jgi:L-cysteine/cystine lyase